MSDVVIRAKVNLPEANKGRVAVVSKERADQLVETGLAVCEDATEATQATEPPEPAPEVNNDRPSGNATEEAWRDYWLTHGYHEDDLIDDEGNPLGRNALRDLSPPS